jgi:triacylglycerol lipase
MEQAATGAGRKVLLMLARRLKWTLIGLLCGSALISSKILGLGGSDLVLTWLLMFPAVAAALREWAAFNLLFVIIQPFEQFWMGEESCGRAEDGSPIVLLAHGYCCNRGLWLWMRARLRAAGFRVATLNFEPDFGDIEVFAEQLHMRIESLLAETGADKIVLATHSMGGLVARAYLRGHGEKKVAALVTLGAPHHGTVVARWGLGRNARQMEPDNAWLNELNATQIGIPVTSVASAGDEFVAPQDSALWPGASEHVLVGHDHLSLVFSDRAASIIRDAARRAAI